MINKKKQKKQINSHLNHMGGISFDIKNPLNKLKVVLSSCFFGEPNYYGSSKFSNAKKPNLFVQNNNNNYLENIFDIDYSVKFKNSELVENVILESLDYDIEKTLQYAVELRNIENIRTTPQVIMVLASHHLKSKGTGLITKYALDIIKRTDEVSVQLAYHKYLSNKTGKKAIPNSLKKSWKKFLEKCTDYDLAKYRMDNREVKTVDVVNLVHAKSESIDKLMKGNLKLSDETWESIISKEGSNKESWTKALNVMGHMALLRNLNNLSKNKVEEKLFLTKLVEGSKEGKQLPFRYYSAYKILSNENTSANILDAVEDSLKFSMDNLPKFKGKVISLCDNSGSAQGTFTSKNGSMKISEIANLSGVLTAKNSEEGYVGIFGDRLEINAIRKNTSIFDDLKTLEQQAKTIGQATEHGIWLFLDNAIKNKEHWDSIFIYSDMQAGHGGLYGNPEEYSDYILKGTISLDVAKLISKYRKNVNKEVNVYLVQVAGYEDTIIPEFYNKTYILGGWGEGILKFASKMENVFN